MTVADLIAALKKFPPAALVVMSHDAEGNGHSPLHNIGQIDADEVERLTNSERAALAVAPVCLWPR
jgi:3',5'-cyclic AMP phosphodiesterase CpdA